MRNWPERALRAAAGLRALGVQAGDRVALVLPNSVGFAEAHFGVLLAGAVSMPMDAAVAPESFRFMAASALPRVLITTAAGAARLAPFDAGLRVVCLDAAAPGALGPEALFDAAAPGAFLDGVDEHELASLMFTTGTTGRAKGVRLSHANVLHALHHIGRFVGYSASDREVVILPLSHNFGLGHLYCNLIHGGAVYTEGGLARVGRVLDMVQRFGATGFPGTPTGFGMLIDRFGPVLAERCANLRFTVMTRAAAARARRAAAGAAAAHRADGLLRAHRGLALGLHLAHARRPGAPPLGGPTARRHAHRDPARGRHARRRRRDR